MFNIASIIASEKKSKKSKTPTGPVVPKQPVVPGIPQATSFKHSPHVILRNALEYKGHHAYVVDFKPAVYRLRVMGSTVVPLREYEQVKQIGDTTMTDFGESVISGYFPASRGKYMSLYLFSETRNPNDIRIGLEITNDVLIKNSLKKEGMDKYQIQKILDHPNNLFIYEIPIIGDLTEQMETLNIGTINTSNLVQQMIDMQLSDNTPSPLKQLVNELKNGDLLDKLVRLSSSTRFEYESSHEDIWKSFTSDISNVRVQVINDKNVIGPKYYMNMSDLNDIKVHNPSKSHYLINYKHVQIFRKSQINATPAWTKYENHIKEHRENTVPPTPAIQVISGQYKNQMLPFISFEPAKLTVMLETNGKSLNRIKVFVKDNMGNSTTRTVESDIYPSDVFYMDIRLKNGNLAQVNRVNPGNQINITEKLESGNYSDDKMINRFDDIESLQPGFKFIDSTSTEEEPTISPVEQLFIHEQEDVQNEGEGDEDESPEFEYPGEAEPEEQPIRATFRDIERTAVAPRELTSRQVRIQTEIRSVLRRLGFPPDAIDTYHAVDMVEDLVNRLAIMTIRQFDLYTTSNMKYIYTCVILYELARTVSHARQTVSEALDLLYPRYFTDNDVNGHNLNQTLFVMPISILTNEVLTPQLNQIAEFNHRSDFKSSILIVLTNAARVIQSIMGTPYNIIERPQEQTLELIPVGSQGKERKAQEEADARERLINARVRIGITSEHLLEDSIPENEVPIRWSSMYISLLNVFKRGLQQKFDKTNDNRYLIVKELLHRGPYGIRDSAINTSSLRNFYNDIYTQLKSKMIDRKLMHTQRRLEAQQDREALAARREEITRRRPREEEEEEEEPIKQTHTSSYLRESQRREMANNIARLTRQINVAEYKDRKKRRQETETTQPESTEQTESTDMETSD